MELLKKKDSPAHRRLVIYIISFIFTLHLTPAVYVNSNFLEQFLPKNSIGYIYTASSIITIIGLLTINKLLRKFGNYKVFISILILEFIALLTISFVPIPEIIIIAFIASLSLTTTAIFNLDVFLEDISSDGKIGAIRGVYLTEIGVAFILGPLISSILITDHNFWRVYTLGAILILPVIYLTARYTKDFKDPIYKKTELMKEMLHVWTNKNLHRVFSCSFLLNFFYSWMVIYTPIFLVNNVGFSIAETTLIISFAILPFVLFDYILGRLADSKYGEKEILTAGLIIIAISTGLMTFISAPIFIIWALILFCTRIGASMIETMTDTYLYKKVDSSDINTIGFYKILTPLAYVFGPVTASLLLLVIDIKYLFIILALILLYGIRFSLTLKDTR